MHVPVIVSCVLLPPIGSPEYEREEWYSIDEEFVEAYIDDDDGYMYRQYEHGDDGASVPIFHVDDHVLREAALAALPIPDGKEGWEVDELHVETC